MGSLERLKRVGFARAGIWKLSGKGLACELSDHASACNVLYAFVLDAKVVYLGKTVQTLRKRMSGYRTPGPTQSTNIKNNGKIREALASGKEVEIFVLPDNGLLKYRRPTSRAL